MLLKGYTSYFLLDDENGEIAKMVDQGGYFPNIPGTLKLEKQIHQQLAKYRIRGEWFNIPVGQAVSILNSHTSIPF